MTVIKHRRDTGANWVTNNPILASGEIAINTTDSSFRVGDGTHNWGDLRECQPGSLYYAGTWNASGGTYPTSPRKGQYYVCTVAGTVSSVFYDVDDWAVYNGSTWNKVIGRYNDDDVYVLVTTTYDLPVAPVNGQLVKIVGTGTNWIVSATGGTYIRMNGDESVMNGTLLSSNGYNCANLIYIGNNRWIVQSMNGTLIIDEA